MAGWCLEHVSRGSAGRPMPSSDSPKSANVEETGHIYNSEAYGDCERPFRTRRHNAAFSAHNITS
jgi:hypothetical protein